VWVRRSALVAVSGLALLVVGSALGGCAEPAAGAVRAPAATVAQAAPPLRQQVDVQRVVSPPPPEPAPCPAAVQACVRLSTAQAWLRRPGHSVLGPVSIGYGVGVHATPVGVFHVAWKAEHYTSHEYHEPMPDAVFFAAGGIAFHAGSLDVASHGCIHLVPTVAALFFSSLRVGAEVQVLP
jgi:lipoprotein-anchoring transpeptidase ErfK/SrfK